MRDIKQLHPRLQELISQLRTICASQGLNIGIGECLRTVAEQDNLYAQGRTKAGKIVTNAKGSSYSSQHQWGVAVDFFKNIKGHEFDDLSFFYAVATQAKRLGLGWGGDWKSPFDPPHLYLTDWGSTTAKLKSLYGTPEKFFKTWGGNSGTTPLAPTSSTTNTPLKNIQSALGATGGDLLSKTITVSRKTNAKHKVVKPLQEWLNSKGYDCGKADGVFGEKTENAVKKLQSTWTKKPDGIISKGQTTWKKILGI